MTATTVTPAARFAALALKQSVSPRSDIARAWREASQWEGFQHSYTAEQVAAGQAFIVAAATLDREAVEEAATRVLALS